MKNRIFSIILIMLLITTTTHFSLSVKGIRIDIYDRVDGHESPEEDENSNPFQFTNVLIRINTTQDPPVIPSGSEVVGARPGEWIDIILPANQLIHLTASQNIWTVLHWDVNAYLQTIARDYHTLTQMEQFLHEIANTYPSITQLYSIGKSYEDRDIWCLEITDNPGVDEGEPGVFFMGLHHAREWPSLEICLHIADRLTSSYGTDANITDMVDNRRIWVVPCVNPDGYYFCHDQGNDWRKNRHFFPEFGTYGVDLNRNYAGSCNGDAWGAWGSLGPASLSHNPEFSVYCGPSALSELETQAIRNMFLENDICATITWHTHGELVMWPWGYSKSEYAPDNSYMAEIGRGIASEITRQGGAGTYLPKKASGLYPTTGDTSDWAYGYSHYVLGRPTFAYTIESCTEFHPDKEFLEQVCNENFDGAFYLLREADQIRNTVVPRVLPPTIHRMANDTDGDYTISWLEQNPAANPQYYQIDELTNLTIIIDNTELNTEQWILNGFSQTEQRSHSGAHSLVSSKNNNYVSTMTTKYPLPITDGMMLSFWCWYDIERNYDYAFVEVSTDRREYHLLDTFTSSSVNWIYKDYDLSEYTDKSIFIRFRYTTDDKTEKAGFFVDDIAPIPKFDGITTLSSNQTNNYYEITGKSNGTYYYRVRGYNEEHSWGDFSTLGKIQVGAQEQPKKPHKPNGPTNGNIHMEYTYTTNTSDSQNNLIYYWFDWGDATNSGWVGPYSSGTTANASHTWTKKGIYTIKVKAKDIHGSESDWSDPLPITMPKSKLVIHQQILHLLEVILDRFPILKRTLHCEI